MDVREESREGLEEDAVAKRKDSVYLFGGNRNAAVAVAVGYVPTIRYLLQHRRRNDWRTDVLCGDESQEEDVKRDVRRIPKGERKALWSAKSRCCSKEVG